MIWMWNRLCRDIRRDYYFRRKTLECRGCKLVHLLLSRCDCHTISHVVLGIVTPIHCVRWSWQLGQFHIYPNAPPPACCPCLVCAIESRKKEKSVLKFSNRQGLDNNAALALSNPFNTHSNHGAIMSVSVQAPVR